MHQMMLLKHAEWYLKTQIREIQVEKPSMLVLPTQRELESDSNLRDIGDSSEER